MRLLGGFSQDPFKLMVVAALAALVGLAGLFAVFFSAHPYFNPFHPREEASLRGWVDEHTYVSPRNFYLRPGEKVTDVFTYPKAGGESIVIFSTQVITVEKKGEMVLMKRKEKEGLDMG